MVMKKASGGDYPPYIASTTVAACSMFSRKEFGSLGFSRRGD
jgi:hypothetical protein